MSLWKRGVHFTKVTIGKKHIAEQLLLKTGLPDEVYAYAQQLIASCNSDIIRMQSPETPYSGMLII